MKTPLLFSLLLALSLISPALVAGEGEKSASGAGISQIMPQISAQISYPEFARYLPGNREVVIYFHFEAGGKLVVDEAIGFDLRLNQHVIREMENLDLHPDTSLYNSAQALRLRFK